LPLNLLLTLLSIPLGFLQTSYNQLQSTEVSKCMLHKADRRGEKQSL
jgi:hypothetical protein